MRVLAKCWMLLLSVHTIHQRISASKTLAHVLQVDRNKNGVIEEVEIEVAVYKLYNIINKRLPGWKDPPSRSQIQVRTAASADDFSMHA